MGLGIRDWGLGDRDWGLLGLGIRDKGLGIMGIIGTPIGIGVPIYIPLIVVRRRALDARNTRGADARLHCHPQQGLAPHKAQSRGLNRAAAAH